MTVAVSTRPVAWDRDSPTSGGFPGRLPLEALLESPGGASRVRMGCIRSTDFQVGGWVVRSVVVGDVIFLSRTVETAVLRRVHFC